MLFIRYAAYVIILSLRADAVIIYAAPFTPAGWLYDTMRQRSCFHVTSRHLLPRRRHLLFRYRFAAAARCAAFAAPPAYAACPSHIADTLIFFDAADFPAAMFDAAVLLALHADATR